MSRKPYLYSVIIGYPESRIQERDYTMSQKKHLFCLFMLILLAFPASALSRDERGVEIRATGQVHDDSWGNYHALIIGINAYKEWRPLKTAVKDAQSLKEILIRRYGFAERNVVLRTDRKATRLRLIGDLRNMASSLGSKDNLLIYFAGHGQLDDLTGDGYWIPVEGKLKNPGTWISHSTVKNILSSEKVRGKNIVVVADSCYSGTLLRGGPSLLSLTDQGYREKLANLASCRSRQVITSGGVEPVADGGRDGHSLFAYYFLKSLKENDRDVIDLENLFHTRVWKPVTEIGGQRPNVGRLKTPMDEDGQFVLVSSGVTVSQPGATTLSVECNVPDADVFVDSRQMGTTPVRDLELSGGTYRLRVEKDGYEPYRKRVPLETGRSITLHVILSKERRTNGRLFVETEPGHARVRILNIYPKFYQGIELEPGRYDVVVSASGYETERAWVDLGAWEDKYIDIRLKTSTSDTKKTKVEMYSGKVSYPITIRGKDYLLKVAPEYKIAKVLDRKMDIVNGRYLIPIGGSGTVKTLRSDSKPTVENKETRYFLIPVEENKDGALRIVKDKHDLSDMVFKSYTNIDLNELADRKIVLERRIKDLPNLNYGGEDFKKFEIESRYITEKDLASLGFRKNDYKFRESILPVVLIRGKLKPETTIKRKGNGKVDLTEKVYGKQFLLIKGEMIDKPTNWPPGGSGDM